MNLRKSEEPCSYVRKQVLKISIENKDNSYEQMKAIGQAYASSQELLTRALTEIGFPSCHLC